MKIKEGNVKLTFYDLTSSSFYPKSCLISTNGHSRNNMSEKKQIIIAEITSYDGFPIKNYVFDGSISSDDALVEAVKDFRKSYRIEDTTFIGDRGMRFKLNLDSIEREGIDYLNGVKHYREEMSKIIFPEAECLQEAYESYWKIKDW